MFPKEKEAAKFYGKPGTNQILLPFPYKTYYEGKEVKKFTINKLCADSASAALTRIGKEYSEDLRTKLGLNVFAGCYNNRPKRGGTELSMHAYACAIDFDPARNQLKWGRDKARLAKKDCETFWLIWEEYDWVSYGRERNFDWMHVQAANL